ncbi:hypothetical protein PhCBS80983_g02510 [Powellomyces hirtus]|uniref:C2 domain-containing protein n=1 Tax=Powellomyces hirtus TaxID=109895 RepID=A0A507E687_9FUNG|nr:hypothetical protein PhCBS80983_g02510 [Powellomyces hirtus]
MLGLLKRAVTPHDPAPALPPRAPQYVSADNSGPVESHTAETSQQPSINEPYYGPPCVDVTFTFMQATGLPKMDIIGSADPYFRASIDGQVDFCSTCISNTLNPTWNELWIVHRVPVTAILSITVFDKDIMMLTDELVGKCQISISPGEYHLTILDPLQKPRGTFSFRIHTAPSMCNPPIPQYVFAGPTRYTTHDSPLVGVLTRLNDTNLYTTWKIHLTLVPVYLPNPTHWNTSYRAAQQIFSGPMSWSVREPIKAAHRGLYARQPKDRGFGALTSGDDWLQLLVGDKGVPKPCMYTYIIDDSTFRFSETGAAFLVDFASKHALHSNCSEFVRYAGEFHLRPRMAAACDHGRDDDTLDGWANLPPPTHVDQRTVWWELIVDNNSGTYAPPAAYLPALQDLLRHNFPGLRVRGLDRQDPFLVRSRNEMKEYAAKYPTSTGIKLFGG